MLEAVVRFHEIELVVCERIRDYAEVVYHVRLGRWRQIDVDVSVLVEAARAEVELLHFATVGPTAAYGRSRRSGDLST